MPVGGLVLRNGLIFQEFLLGVPKRWAGEHPQGGYRGSIKPGPVYLQIFAQSEKDRAGDTDVDYLEVAVIEELVPMGVRGTDQH